MSIESNSIMPRSAPVHQVSVVEPKIKVADEQEIQRFQRIFITSSNLQGLVKIIMDYVLPIITNELTVGDLEYSQSHCNEVIEDCMCIDAWFGDGTFKGERISTHLRKYKKLFFQISYAAVLKNASCDERIKGSLWLEWEREGREKYKKILEHPFFQDTVKEDLFEDFFKFPDFSYLPFIFPLDGRSIPSPLTYAIMRRDVLEVRAFLEAGASIKQLAHKTFSPNSKVSSVAEFAKRSLQDSIKNKSCDDEKVENCKEILKLIEDKEKEGNWYCTIM